MSDEEGFLRRWSRLKRDGGGVAPGDGEAAASAERDKSERQATPDSGDGLEPQPSNENAAGAARAEELRADGVDLSALPPIESITATTDIRAFLAPGIPAQLTRAALRRAWSADPAVRDFVGLAENAWDFNAPGGVPGFGPLMEADSVRQVVAELADKVTQQDAAEVPAADEGLEKRAIAATEEAGASAAGNPGPHPATGEPNNDAAVQKEAAKDADPQPARRHGGALPL
jgi:uncharacterized protein DUF3306